MIKKLTKIGLLLSVKESYLFSKNSLGLVLHPFKTLRGLRREKDRSQQLLILGWPIYALMIGLLGVYVGRRLLSTTVEWGVLARLSFCGVVITTLLVGGYLGYWIVKAWSADWRDKRIE